MWSSRCSVNVAALVTLVSFSRVILRRAGTGNLLALDPDDSLAQGCAEQRWRTSAAPLVLQSAHIGPEHSSGRLHLRLVNAVPAGLSAKIAFECCREFTSSMHERRILVSRHGLRNQKISQAVAVPVPSRDSWAAQTGHLGVRHILHPSTEQLGKLVRECA